MKRKYGSITQRQPAQDSANTTHPSDRGSLRANLLSFILRTQSFDALLQEKVDSGFDRAPSSLTAEERPTENVEDGAANGSLSSFLLNYAASENIFSCTTLIAEKLFDILKESNTKDQRIRTLLKTIHTLQARHKFSRSQFAELLFKCADSKSVAIPMQLVWRLSRENIVPFRDYLKALASSTHASSKDSFVRELKGFGTQREAVEATTTEGLFDAVMEELIRIAMQSMPGSAEEKGTAMAIEDDGAGSCASEILYLLTMPETDEDDSQIQTEELHLRVLGIARKVTPARLRAAFFQHELESIFRSPPVKRFKISFEQAYSALNSVNNSESQRYLNNLRGKIADEILSFFPATKIIESIHKAVTHNEGNWYLVFLFIQKLSVTSEGPALMLAFLKSLVNEALSSLKEHPLKVAILFYRILAPKDQAATILPKDGNKPNFISYSLWFRNTVMTGNESNITARKLSQLLLRVLISVLPLDTPYYVKLHLGMIQKMKKVDTSLMQEYVNLTRKKLNIADDVLSPAKGDIGATSPTSASSLISGYTKEAAEAEVQKFVARFAVTGSIASLHQALLLRPAWFHSIFVPTLLTPLPLSQIGEDKRKFISALVADTGTAPPSTSSATTSSSLGLRKNDRRKKLLSSEMVEKWKSDCLRLEQEQSNGNGMTTNPTLLETQPQDHRLLSLIERLKELAASKKSKENDALISGVLEDIENEANRMNSENALFSDVRQEKESSGGEHQLVESLLNGFVSVLASEINGLRTQNEKSFPDHGEIDWMEDYARNFFISQRMQEVTAVRLKHLLLHDGEKLDKHSINSLGALLGVFSDLQSQLKGDTERQSGPLLVREIWSQLPIDNKQRMIAAARLAVAYIECAAIRLKLRVVPDGIPNKENAEEALDELDRMVEDKHPSIVLDITDEDEQKKSPVLKRRRRNSTSITNEKRVAVLPPRMQHLLLWLSVRFNAAGDTLDKETKALADTLTKYLHGESFISEDAWFPLEEWLRTELMVGTESDVLGIHKRLYMMRDVIYLRYLPLSKMEGVAEGLLSILLEANLNDKPDQNNQSRSMDHAKEGGYSIVLHLLQEVLVHLPSSDILLSLLDERLKRTVEAEREYLLSSFFNFATLLPPNLLFTNPQQSVSFLNRHINFFRSDHCTVGVIVHLLRGLMLTVSASEGPTDPLMEYLGKVPILSLGCLQHWDTLQKVLTSLPTRHRLVMELENIHHAVQGVLTSDNLPKEAPFLLAVIKGNHGLLFAHALLQATMEKHIQSSSSETSQQSEGDLLFPSDVKERTYLLCARLKLLFELILKDHAAQKKPTAPIPPKKEKDGSEEFLSVSKEPCSAEAFLTALFDGMIFKMTTRFTTTKLKEQEEANVLLQQAACDLWLALPAAALTVLVPEYLASADDSDVASTLLPSHVLKQTRAARKLLLPSPMDSDSQQSMTPYALYPLLFFRLLASGSLHRRYIIADGEDSSKEEGRNLSMTMTMDEMEEKAFLSIVLENYVSVCNTSLSAWRIAHGKEFRANVRRMVVTVVKRHSHSGKRNISISSLPKSTLTKLQDCDPEIAALLKK